MSEIKLVSTKNVTLLRKYSLKIFNKEKTKTFNIKYKFKENLILTNITMVKQKAKEDILNLGTLHNLC